MQNIYDVSSNYCMVSKKEKEPDKIARINPLSSINKKKQYQQPNSVVIYLCLEMKETDALGWLWFPCI